DRDVLGVVDLVHRAPPRTQVPADRTRLVEQHARADLEREHAHPRADQADADAAQRPHVDPGELAARWSARQQADADDLAVVVVDARDRGVRGAEPAPAEELVIVGADAEADAPGGGEHGREEGERRAAAEPAARLANGRG